MSTTTFRIYSMIWLICTSNIYWAATKMTTHDPNPGIQTLVESPSLKCGLDLVTYFSQTGDNKCVTKPLEYFVHPLDLLPSLSPYSRRNKLLLCEYLHGELHGQWSERFRGSGYSSCWAVKWPYLCLIPWLMQWETLDQRHQSKLCLDLIFILYMRNLNLRC